MNLLQTIITIFTLLLLLINAITGLTLTQGLINDDNYERIANGYNATEGQFPWQVIIAQTVPNTLQTYGGSLISQNWVITVATILSGITTVSCQMGSVVRNQQTFTVSSSVFLIHPYFGFGPSVLSNNIALIQLPVSVGLTARIQPIRLVSFSQRNYNFANEVVVTTGFGTTTANGTINSNLLQWTNVRVIANTNCTNLPVGITAPSGTVCTVGVMNNAGACNGDQGSSLVFYENTNATLIGLVLSPNCNTHSSIYTLIGEHLAWISGITGIATRP